MITIPITYTGHTPSMAEPVEIVSGQRETVRVHITFSAEWDMYPVRTAVFASRAGVRKAVMDADGYAIVPASMLQSGIRYLQISVFGNYEREDGEIPRYNGRPLTLRVDIGGAVPSESDDNDPAYEKLLIRLIAVEESLGTAIDYANDAGDRANASAEDADRAAAEARAEVEAADNAAARALESQRAAEKSEKSAAQSASDSALSAADAAQSAAEAADSVAAGKYISFEIKEDGNLYMSKTADYDELDFYLDADGNLYMEVVA